MINLNPLEQISKCPNKDIDFRAYDFQLGFPNIYCVLGLQSINAFAPCLHHL